MKRGPPRSPYMRVAADFGYLLLAALILLGYGGYWLDQRWGTDPFLLIGGVLLAIATSFQSLFRQLRDIKRHEQKTQGRSREAKDD